MIWLASFPRSGNTFFRLVLYEVYGIESSSFHREPARPLEPGYDRHPVVKTHLLPSQVVPSDPDIRAVYLVRDGRDALVSMARHRSDLINPGTDFRSNLEEAILAQEGSYFGGWSRNVLAWLDRAALVVRFEDLIAAPIETVERLRPLFDLPPPRRERLPTFEDLRTKEMRYGNGRGLSAAAQAERRKKFFRRGVVGAWRDEMPDDLHHLFWQYHAEAMDRLGYQRAEAAPRRLKGMAEVGAKRAAIAGRSLGHWLGQTAFDWGKARARDLRGISHPPTGRRVFLFAYVRGLNGTRVHQELFRKVCAEIPGYRFETSGVPPRQAYDLYFNLVAPYDAYDHNVSRQQNFYETSTPSLWQGNWKWAQVAYHRIPWTLRAPIMPMKERALRRIVGRLPSPEKWITVCHDLTPLICRDWFSYPEGLELNFLSNFLKARHIVAVSENTRADLVRFGVAAEKISVVYNTYDPAFNLEDRGLAPPLSDYFLVVSSFEPRKNAGRVYEAFGRIRDQVPGKLVFIGSDKWGKQDIYDIIRRDPRCVVVESISKRELIGWYHGARALVYASLYEGFGLPIMEAMGCGVPVVCSNGSGMREVGEGYAELVDPTDPSDIAAKMLKVVAPGYAVDLEARRRILDRFSLQANATRLKAALDRLSSTTDLRVA